MPRRPALSLLALLVGLVLAGPGPAAPPSKKPPAPSPKEVLEQEKKAAEEVKKAAEEARKRAEEARKKAAEEAARLVREEFKGKEAEALKEAFILLSAANHDFDGHRGKALHEVQEACPILDANILKNGCVQQRIKALQQDQVAAAAKAAAKTEAAVHESQLAADVQMARAGAMVKEVATVLAGNKQREAFEHAAAAVKEIELALATR